MLIVTGKQQIIDNFPFFDPPQRGKRTIKSCNLDREKVLKVLTQKKLPEEGRSCWKLLQPLTGKSYTTSGNFLILPPNFRQLQATS